jgi:acyl carrier protein
LLASEAARQFFQPTPKEEKPMTALTSEEVLAELQPIIGEALAIPGLVVTRESNANNTRNWDSLAHISLIEMVEHHFKVRFALGELQDLKEVGDLVDLIAEKTNR